jgi:hypothetical protein
MVLEHVGDGLRRYPDGGEERRVVGEHAAYAASVPASKVGGVRTRNVHPVPLGSAAPPIATICWFMGCWRARLRRSSCRCATRFPSVAIRLARSEREMMTPLQRCVHPRLPLRCAHAWRRVRRSAHRGRTGAMLNAYPVLLRVVGFSKRVLGDQSWRTRFSPSSSRLAGQASRR